MWMVDKRYLHNHDSFESSHTKMEMDEHSIAVKDCLDRYNTDSVNYATVPF